MKGFGRLSAIVALATVVGSTTAGAQTCGGSDFKTCASVSITPSVVSSTVTHVVMTVTNMSGFAGTYAGTIFGAFGVFGLPQFTLVANSFGFSGSGNWAFGSQGLSGSGVIQEVAGTWFTGQGGVQTNGLAAGQSVTVWFDLSGVTLAQVDPNDWVIHGQSGPAGCSTKLVTTDGSPNDGPYNALCGVDPGTGLVTPEPASLLLLGTGMVGLTGFVRRRRRTS